MDYLSDLLLGAGALAAVFYCMVLSRRLAKFNDLEKGVGGAVAVLAMQVDDLTKTMEKAQTSAKQTSSELQTLVARAEDAVGALQLQMASLHDLPSANKTPKPQVTPDTTVFVRHRENA
ncbi:hypothetical protein [Nereida sp. MMG025]|uniref:hypothetical protein n=1 Tax=Nereida sp. MMG025 TaxID=2909981 RepID=UPI001F27BD5B|nr:hypothetical protein [Nereida sp. MMG025]MCF6444667.1 hypothetical protein [Nereida sp. MMG025]